MTWECGSVQRIWQEMEQQQLGPCELRSQNILSPSRPLSAQSSSWWVTHVNLVSLHIFHFACLRRNLGFIHLASSCIPLWWGGIFPVVRSMFSEHVRTWFAGIWGNWNRLFTDESDKHFPSPAKDHNNTFPVYKGGLFKTTHYFELTSIQEEPFMA